MDTLNDDVFSEDQLEALATSLTPDEIETKQGNLQYLKGQYAIAKANRIFGVGNWSYEVLGPIEVIETGSENSNNKKIYLATAMVKLNIRGCLPFVEQGDCEAQGDGYAAMSMARKGAVTDGVKRCLKNLGPSFGLELYLGKQISKGRSNQPFNSTANTSQNRQQAPQQIRTSNLPSSTQNAPQTATQPQQNQSQERITKLQLAAIKKMQETLKISDSGMEKRVNELYGSDLIEITKSDADHLIKVLTEKTKQDNTTSNPTAQPAEQQQQPQEHGPDAPNGQLESWCQECAGPAIWKSGVSREKGPWGGYFCQDTKCKKVQWVKVK